MAHLKPSDSIKIIYHLLVSNRTHGTDILCRSIKILYTVLVSYRTHGTDCIVRITLLGERLCCM